VDLGYETRGEGPPVLLIHGTAGAVWGTLPEVLARDRRVIVYSRRGFGPSPGPLGATQTEHAGDAAELLDELGTGPATIVGWSMGGVIALELALARPDLVSSLVLVEPPLHAKKHPSLAFLRAFAKLTIQRRRDERAAAETFLRWATRFTDGGSGYELAPPADREEMLGNASAILAELDTGTDESLKLEAVGSIRGPVTLVVGGRSDRVFPKAVGRIAKVLPDARVERLAQAGHGIPIEQPEELAALVP
jgi:pimeloyl-ACP methyl ester carboxylesterase